MMNGEDGEVKGLIKSVKIGEITRRFYKHEEAINLELRDRIAELEEDLTAKDERIKELEQALSSWYNGFSQCEITPGMVRNTELILKGGKK